MAPIGVLIDVRALGELGDKALPEEHCRGRADRAHEIDRDRQRRVHGLHENVRQPIALIVDAVDHAFVPAAFRGLVEPALAHRPEQRLPRDTGVHGERIAALVEHCAKTATCVRPEDVMLDVFLARANELDRTAYSLGRLHGLQHVIRYDLAAKAPAQEGDIDFHVVRSAADGLRYGLLARGHRLDGSPDLDTAMLVAGRGVDRLEWSMRDVRQHEAPLDDRGRASFENFSRLPTHKRSDAMLGVQGSSQHGVDPGGREVARCAALECHLECIECALGLPELVGDHANRVVARQIWKLRMLGACVFVGDGQRRDLHHRAHAGHFENIRFVLDRGQFSGDGARGFDGRVEHTGNRDIHAEDRTAIALGWRVQSRERLADEPEGAAVLERRVGVERKLGGGGGKLTIRQAFSSRIDHETVFGVALHDVDIPALRCRAGQDVTGSGACSTQATIERRSRHRSALFLRWRLLPKCNLVGRFAGCEPEGRVGRRDLLTERGVRALPYLRL